MSLGPLGLLGCPRKLVNGLEMGYNLLVDGVHGGYNPLTNHLQTSWDIQVLTRGTYLAEL